MATGIALVVLVAFMIPMVSAQPVQQATDTPEATVAATNTPEATLAPTEMSPVATPTATAVSTPSTLPTTGGSDGGAAVLGFVALVFGALILFGGLGVAVSRHTR
jgi:Asp-tRNA(Asn)/Glu-tRNA(Gln) amidotransferase A subunit family amidase